MVFQCLLKGWVILQLACAFPTSVRERHVNEMSKGKVAQGSSGHRVSRCLKSRAPGTCRVSRAMLCRFTVMQGFVEGILLEISDDDVLSCDDTVMKQVFQNCV
jgi:hypothetical protein